MLSSLSSLKLTILLMVALCLLVFAGAYIPQSINEEELCARFGDAIARIIAMLGLNRVFSSSLFLLVTGMLFLNLVACSVSRQRSRVTHRLIPGRGKSAGEIASMSHSISIDVSDSVESRLELVKFMRARRFLVTDAGSRLIFEKGRMGYLAGPCTHLGLFLLLGGVAFSAACGYSGCVSGTVGSRLSVPAIHAQQPLLGKAEQDWLVIKDTRRENHPSGEPKQWKTELEILDKHGHLRSQGITSVNNPLTVNSVTYYQADWQLKAVTLKFGKQLAQVPLERIGNSLAGVVSLSKDLSLVVVVASDGASLQIYGVLDEQPSANFLADLKLKQTVTLDALKIAYEAPVAVTTLQYKYDPGLPLVHASFVFLLMGAALVSVPRCRIFACLETGDDSRLSLYLGWEPTPFQSLAENELESIAQVVAPHLKPASGTSNFELLPTTSVRTNNS